MATERYLRSSTNFNSYILGSSRAGVGFPDFLLEPYLKKTDTVYSFAASNESIFGIAGKLKLIDRLNRPLDNVLIVLDPDRTFKRVSNSTGHLYIKHPLVSGESKDAFVKEYMKDYIFTGFFVAYWDYSLFKTKRKYMQKFLNFDANPAEEYIAFNLKKRAAQIRVDSIHYYRERKDQFYERPGKETVLKKQIFSTVLDYLTEIKLIADKHHTAVKIIISPLYDQKKLNPADLAILQDLFGRENVVDFSGKNAITEDKRNYFENSHFKPYIGSDILKKVYSGTIKKL